MSDTLEFENPLPGRAPHRNCNLAQYPTDGQSRKKTRKKNAYTQAEAARIRMPSLRTRPRSLRHALSEISQKSAAKRRRQLDAHTPNQLLQAVSIYLIRGPAITTHKLPRLPPVSSSKPPHNIRSLFGRQSNS
jgi:hypothetical protein